MLSSVHFLDAFASESGNAPVVLLVDQFEELGLVPEDIKNEFLQALWEIRNNKDRYAIHGVIAAGTFSILHMTSTKTCPSPFDISNSIQNPYFSVEETNILFDMYAQDKDIIIEDDVIEDIWAKTYGYLTQLIGLSS
jgi:hypothetical protein